MSTVAVLMLCYSEYMKRCVCISSLQCPAPVDPTVCPRHRGAAAAAVCVWRPLCTLSPRAKLSLVSGLGCWKPKKQVTLGRILLGGYARHITVNLTVFHPSLVVLMLYILYARKSDELKLKKVWLKKTKMLPLPAIRGWHFRRKWHCNSKSEITSCSFNKPKLWYATAASASQPNLNLIFRVFIICILWKMRREISRGPQAVWLCWTQPQQSAVKENSERICPVVLERGHQGDTTV